MSIISKYRPLVHLLAATLLLPLVCACSSSDTADDPASPKPEIANSNHYINLSIVVSSGNESAMRGTPQGGEEGDGREAGSERENHVEGITLMLYRDDNGINTTSTETTFDFVQFYSVNLVKTEDEGTQYNKKTDEAIYTTGDQPLDNTGLDLTATYHAIIVANRDLSDKVIPGKTKVISVGENIGVRDYVSDIVLNYDQNRIFIGSGIGVDAEKFVMASEDDTPINFNDPVNRTIKGGKTYFTFENIRIERLAARVDFWTRGATYKQERSGYEYTVVKENSNEDSGDRFVLTAITPFNLYKGDEYYIKHVNPAENGTIKYLEDETENSYVIDPMTKQKEVVTSGNEPNYYSSKLSNIIDLDDMDEAGTFRFTTEYLYNSIGNTDTQSTTFDGIGNANNFILCYPKENALMLSSPLYYYATGVAIEGYYYKNGQETGDYLIYYGFLRHQGEQTDKDTYDINTKDDFKGKENTPVGDQGTPMNFSVVRNNIYRISIDRITQKKEEEKKPEIKLQIKVKKWDTFTHDIIYM